MTESWPSPQRQARAKHGGFLSRKYAKEAARYSAESAEPDVFECLVDLLEQVAPRRAAKRKDSVSRSTQP